MLAIWLQHGFGFCVFFGRYICYPKQYSQTIRGKIYPHYLEELLCFSRFPPVSTVPPALLSSSSSQRKRNGHSRSTIHQKWYPFRNRGALRKERAWSPFKELINNPQCGRAVESELQNKHPIAVQLLGHVTGIATPTWTRGEAEFLWQWPWWFVGEEGHLVDDNPVLGIIQGEVFRSGDSPAPLFHAMTSGFTDNLFSHWKHDAITQVLT